MTTRWRVDWEQRHEFCADHADTTGLAWGRSFEEQTRNNSRKYGPGNSYSAGRIKEPNRAWFARRAWHQLYCVHAHIVQINNYECDLPCRNVNASSPAHVPNNWGTELCTGFRRSLKLWKKISRLDLLTYTFIIFYQRLVYCSFISIMLNIVTDFI